jgi:arsenate reductase
MKAKRVIFVCVGNSCRSQMAEGFLKHLACERGVPCEVHSGGTRPEGYVHPLAIQVMAECGIDISGQTSKALDRAQLGEFDYVISMGCADQEICPANFAGESRDWQIADPFGHPIESYRRVRDEIEQRVCDLLAELAAR